MAGTRLHATCVVIGEAGVLIRGPSGSGKSLLAREIVLEAGRDGSFARLVGDDQVEIEERHGRLIARALASIAGRLELRGLGLRSVPYEPAAVVRLVVDCLPEPPARMPEASEMRTQLSGITVLRLALSARPGASRIVLWRLGELDDTSMTVS
jgi:HPr kinase/phosphorylase